MRWVRWVCSVGAMTLLAAGVPAAGSAAVAQAATAPVTTGIGRTYGGAGHSFSVPAGYPEGSLVRLWSRTVSGPLISPLIIGSAVVTATRSSGLGGSWSDLQAFDGVTGTPLWPPLAIGTGVAALTSDGQRIFALADANVIAVDLATGRVLWSRVVMPFDSEMPTLYGGLLWVNSLANNVGLAALDPATGAVVHSYPSAGNDNTMALVGHTLYNSSCAYDLPSGAPVPTGGGGNCEGNGSVSQSDGRVVVSPAYLDFSHLVVLDVGTAGRLWSPPTGLVALDNGRLLLATDRKQFTLSSYAETTGALGWSITLPSRPASPPLVFGGAVAIASMDGHLRRYSAATGALVDDTLLAGRPMFSFVGPLPAPAADSGLLAVPSGKTLTVFRGTSTGTPPVLSRAATARPHLPAPATGLDTADGTQYAEDPGHDGVAIGSTLTGPLHLAWNKTMPGTVSNAILDSSGRLFVSIANPDGTFGVYRLDRRTGAVVWGPVHLTGGIKLDHAHLALGGGLLVDYEIGTYTGSGSNGLVHGIDPATGAVRWTTTLATRTYGYDGYPTVAGGRVYVHYHDDIYGGVALALDLQTGKTLWATQVVSDLDTLGPAAGDGLVYYPSGDSVYGLDPATGHYAYPPGSYGSPAGPSSAVEAAGRLYVNTFQGSGQVFDAATGHAAGAGMFATRRPAVDAAHGVLIALQGNRITAESLTDRTRYWTVTDKSIPSLSPLVANGMVITGDNSGRLLVLDEATGKQLWSDPQAFAPTGDNLMQGKEPAQITVGAGGLAVTSGDQLRLYAGAVDNGPAGP